LINQIILPWSIVPLTLFVGILITAFRPYWGFLFATFVSISLSLETLHFTRIPFIGLYINMYDICMVISIIAFLADRRQKRNDYIWPKPALAIMLVLFIGFIHSLVQYESLYITIRSFRWAVTLPIVFIIAANMVRGERRIRYLLLTLLTGAILASLQHLLWVEHINAISHASSNPEMLRSIAFVRAGPEAWLIAGPFLIGRRFPKVWLQLAIGAVFLASALTHQTRSVALGVVGALLLYHLWFLKGPNAFRWKRILTLSSIFVGGMFILGALNLSNLAENYWERLRRSWEYFYHDPTTETRRNTLQVEFDDWINGNRVIGEGLFYYQRYGYGYQGSSTASVGRIAFGHLGYIGYLSQLGLFGFLVYGVWLPLSVLLNAQRVIKIPGQPQSIVYLGALTGAMFLFSVICFIFSNSFLSMHIVPGLLAGAIWAIPTNNPGTKIPQGTINDRKRYHIVK
jgi:hypothetical protein